MNVFVQVPNEMKGKMAIEIMSGASGHISTLNLHSDNGNAIYVTEGKHEIFAINYLLFLTFRFLHR